MKRHKPIYTVEVGGHAPKHIPAKRICARGGCDTILSGYNLSTLCQIHRSRKPVKLRVSNPKSEVDKISQIHLCQHHCGTAGP